MQRKGGVLLCLKNPAWPDTSHCLYGERGPTVGTWPTNLPSKAADWFPHGENHSRITEKYISQTSWVWAHNIWIRSCSIKKHIFEGAYSCYRSSNVYCSRGLNIHLLLLSVLIKPVTVSPEAHFLCSLNVGIHLNSLKAKAQSILAFW